MLAGNDKQAIVIIIPRANQQARTVIDKSKLIIAKVVWHFNVNLLYCTGTCKTIVKSVKYQSPYVDNKMFFLENTNASWTTAAAYFQEN